MADTSSKSLCDLVFVAHADACCFDDDLISNWQIVDPSDDDDEVDYCFDDDLDVDNHSIDPHHEDDVGNVVVVVVDDDDDGVRLGTSISIVSSDLISDHPINFHGGDDHDHDRDDDGVRDRYEHYDDYGDEDHEDDDDDGGDEYDLDDELVPKSMSGRFGRERMRKLGKRGYTKMNKSKRLAYSYNRPGCVYGKHGLGLKHSLI